MGKQLDKQKQNIVVNKNTRREPNTQYNKKKTRNIKKHRQQTYKHNIKSRGNKEKKTHTMKEKQQIINIKKHMDNNKQSKTNNYRETKKGIKHRNKFVF